MQDQTPQQPGRPNTLSNIARRLIDVVSSSNIFGVNSDMQGDFQETVTQAHLQDRREEEARRITEEQRIERLEQDAIRMWQTRMPNGVQRDVRDAIIAYERGNISNDLFGRYASFYDSHFNQWQQYYIDHVRDQDRTTLENHVDVILGRLAEEFNTLNTIRWNSTSQRNSLPASAYSFPPGYAGSSSRSSGGAMPRAHMALQSLESQNVSQYFRNLSHY